MNRILTAVAAGKDAGRQVKYFVRGDMGVSYGQFTSLKGRHGLRVNGAPVHANHLLRAAYPAMKACAERILECERAKEAADELCMPIDEILTLV